MDWLLYSLLQTWGYLTFAALAKPSPEYRPLRTTNFILTPTFDLDPDLWPWLKSKGSWWQTVTSKHYFYHLTLIFDLRPWHTIPAYSRSRSTSMQKIKVKGQIVQPWECPQTHGRTDRRTLPILLSPCFAKATRSINIGYPIFSKDVPTLIDNRKLRMFYTLRHEKWTILIQVFREPQSSLQCCTSA